MADAPDIDLLSAEFFAGEPRPAYAWMREHGGVWFDETSGLWGIASYDAVVSASTRPALFSSAQGSRPQTGSQPSMINMDDPEHRNRRSLINRGFTPRRIADHESRVRQICDEILDGVCEKGSCDLVDDIAAPLPLIVIGDMLGVLPEDRDDLLRWSDDMLASQGAMTEANITRAAGAFMEYYTYANKVIAARRAKPTDDLISVLVHAELGGDPIDDLELVHETLLILVGGDETTRHVIAGGIEALLRRPDQWQRLADEPAGIPTAVEEMLRWVSPIKSMNRTLASDTTFHGQEMRAGQQALLLYESANFDETRFDSPEIFDIARSPNEHLAFGVGAHFCLGASLARLELRVMVERILTRLPDLHLVSEEPAPRRLNSFITGFEHLPVTFTPTPSRG